MKALVLLFLLLQGCTLGEALLGAGAAGLGGYVIGEHQRPVVREYHSYYYHNHYGYQRYR